MGELIIVGRRERYDKDKFYRVDVTSHNKNDELRESLSPFFLGKCDCYDGLQSMNMENAWQYSKVYPNLANSDGSPSPEYFKWRDSGWNKKMADRHPMGREIPLYSYWKDDNGNEMRLGYIEARKKIYIPLYAKCVFNNPKGLTHIKELLVYNNIALADFDGYNHKALNQSYWDVLNNPRKKMGHAFVLGMIIEGYVYEKDGKIVIDEDKMKESRFEQLSL